MTRNHNSDIRLGSRLLTVATMICTGFATAALVVYLRGNPISVTMDSESPTSVELPAPGGETEQDRIADIRMAESAAAAPSPFGGIEQSIRTVASHRPRLTQVASQTTTPTHERSFDSIVSQAGEHGVYVPVTVHPVTVNIDGATFADQLSRIANGVDQMLATYENLQRSQQAVGGSATSDAARQDQIRRQDERFTQIDMSLRKLSATVESLRAESQITANNQIENTQQAELASKLMAEFQNTLAEHRQFLADASRTASVATDAPDIRTVQTEPLAEELPTVDFTDDFDFVDEPATAESDFDEWDDSIESPEVDILLPEEPALEVIEFDSEPVVLEPLLPEESEPTVDPAPPLQLSDSPIGMNQAADVIFPNNRASRPEDNQEALVSLFPEETVEEVAVHAPHLNLPQRPGNGKGTFDQVPAIPFTAPIVSRKDPPVVYEQNYRFALPPATDPLSAFLPVHPGVQTVRSATTMHTPQPMSVTQEAKIQQFPRLVFGAAQVARTEETKKHEGRQRKYGRHSNRLVGGRTVRHPVHPQQHYQMPPMPAPAPPAVDYGMQQANYSQPVRDRAAVAPSYDAAPPSVHRHMPVQHQHGPSHIIHGTRPNPLQQALGNGIDAATDFGSDVHDRTTGMLSRLSGPRQPAIHHQRNAHHRPSGLLHRVGAAIRGVGRPQTVE